MNIEDGVTRTAATPRTAETSIRSYANSER
nr:MAG TPA: hypothetical protein [Caudoviricetes sp.]